VAKPANHTVDTTNALRASASNNGEGNVLGLSIPKILPEGIMSDEQLQAYISTLYPVDSSQSTSYDRDISTATPSDSDTTDEALESKPDTTDASAVGSAVAGASDASAQGVIDYGYSFDPRVVRFDGFKSTGGIMPFASDTASSAYFDMVFTIEKGIGVDSSNGGISDNSKTNGSDKTVMGDPTYLKNLQNDPNMYGVQSLINPYCVTRLVGGLTADASSNMRSNMYDIRDQKRFYDNAGASGSAIV
jgi:hypothetical protein